MATITDARDRAPSGSPAWQAGLAGRLPLRHAVDGPLSAGAADAPCWNTAARRFPDRPACTLYGRPTTYARLDDQARRLARSLIELGAGPGRHVGLLLPNIPEYLVALQAVWLTGATALQLSPLMVAEEVGHWLEATGCHIVVTLDLLAPAVIGLAGARAAGARRPDLAGPAHGHVARHALPHRAAAPQRLLCAARRRPPAPLRRPARRPSR